MLKSYQSCMSRVSYLLAKMLYARELQKLECAITQHAFYLLPAFYSYSLLNGYPWREQKPHWWDRALQLYRKMPLVLQLEHLPNIHIYVDPTSFYEPAHEVFYLQKTACHTQLLMAYVNCLLSQHPDKATKALIVNAVAQCHQNTEIKQFISFLKMDIQLADKSEGIVSKATKI